MKHITVTSEDKSERSVSVASFDALLPTGADVVLLESSGPLPPFTAENVRTMVGKHATIMLIGPDTRSWPSWMISNVVENNGFQPCFLQAYKEQKG